MARKSTPTYTIEFPLIHSCLATTPFGKEIQDCSERLQFLSR